MPPFITGTPLSLFMTLRDGYLHSTKRKPTNCLAVNYNVDTSSAKVMYIMLDLNIDL